jgi:hypothetical protein
VIGNFVGRAQRRGPRSRVKSRRKFLRQSVGEVMWTARILQVQGFQIWTNIFLFLLAFSTCLLIVSAGPLLSSIIGILHTMVTINQGHFHLYCSNVTGEEEGRNCSYSLITRMLLILAGEETNPGPVSSTWDSKPDT